MYKLVNGKLIHESIDLRNEYLYNYRKRWIIDTKHASQRIIERNQLTIEEMELLFKRSIDKVLACKNCDCCYLFYSKGLKQGMVTEYRQDFRNKNGERHLILVTYLPRGKNRPNDSETKLLTTEQINNIEIIELE